jgi:hypothetical protein
MTSHESSSVPSLMNKADTLTDNVARGLGKKTGNAPAAAAPDCGVGGIRHDHVDAINQLFAELELAYHNQYHKAYAQEGSIVIAKKYWLECLVPFVPAIILKAVRNVVKTQQYLPSVATIIKACENALEEHGLPAAHDAYVQACCALHPKAEHKWSHPAVYLAGKATGWFELESNPENKIYPLFESHYRKLCRRVLAGEELVIEATKALPKHSAKKLSLGENKSRMAELRKSIKK